MKRPSAELLDRTLDPRAEELTRQLESGPAWPKLAAIVLGVLAFILLAARIQFGVILGLELTPPLMVMPIAVGSVLGTVLATAWHFYRRAAATAELLALEQTRNAVFLARLEELVEVRSGQLRETEAQMLRQQKFAALGRMAAGVAHDFNNLLTTVALGAQELALPELEDAERRELSDAISQACERGAGITRQLQATSAAQLHRPELVDLCQLVRGDLGVWRTLAGSGVELVHDIPESRLDVRLDPAQFHRVILNLVVNACQALGREGRLSLRVGRCGPAEVFVAVADTGGGIPPAIAERIFEPFFTTRETGTGLGLAVVRGIVTKAGGRIELEVAGGETTFTVILPEASEASDEAPDAATTTSARARHMKVALVDADPTVRQMVLRQLRRLGHEVDVFDEPAQLLAGDEVYDLLMTDIALSGLSGPELAVGLREARRVRGVVLMSGLVDEKAELGLAKLQDASILQKPFGAEELTQILEAS